MPPSRPAHLTSTAGRRSTFLAAAAGVAACLAAAGCGGGSSSNGEAAKPAAQVLQDAKAAMGKLTSFHAAGSEDTGGQQIAVDLDLGKGRGGGSITAQGVTLQVVEASPTVYLKGDAATWTKLAGSAQAGTLLGGRWVKTTTANQAFASLTQLTDLSSFLSSLSLGSLRKGAVTTFAGHQALPLTDTGGANGTVYVATSGQPYLLGADGTGSKSAKGTLTFDHFDTATIPAPPQGAVDLDQLEQGSSAGAPAGG